MSTPTPTPSPTLLRVKSVRILDNNNVMLAIMQDPNIIMQVASNASPHGIEVEFENASLDYSSVKDKTTFIVRQSNVIHSGQIIALPSNTVRWDWIATDPPALPKGRYKITLLGDPPLPPLPAITIRSALPSGLPGPRLDGDSSHLPSGDGKEGGDFVFTFLVT
jgi:hypothetical protein